VPYKYTALLISVLAVGATFSSGITRSISVIFVLVLVVVF
jgi:hypothetical protein